jgi:hypothetical protein
MTRWANNLLIPFNPTSSNRARPSEHSLTAGQCSHGRVIVGYVPDRSGPASSGTLQNCVARMRRADLDHVRDGRLPVVTRQPDAAGIYDHSPIPQANHSRNVSVSAEDDLGVDSFSSSLNSVDRTRAYAAVDCHVVEPKSSVVPRRCVAKEHLFSMHKRGWHARHPIEVLALKLPEIAPSRGACLPEFNKNSILIAQRLRFDQGLVWVISGHSAIRSCITTIVAHHVAKSRRANSRNRLRSDQHNPRRIHLRRMRQPFPKFRICTNLKSSGFSPRRQCRNRVPGCIPARISEMPPSSSGVVRTTKPPVLRTLRSHTPRRTERPARVLRQTRTRLWP